MVTVPVADAALLLGGVVVITTCLAFVFARSIARAPMGEAIETAAINAIVLCLLIASGVLVFS
jgi:hypothetical protein